MYNEFYWASDEIKHYFIPKSYNELMKEWYICHTCSQPISSVLDIGCGYGRNLLPFVEIGCDVHCYDTCPDAVLFTARRFGLNKKHYAVAPIQEQLWKNRIFDFIICDGVLHQLTTKKQYVDALKYCASMLHSGLFFLSVFTANVLPKNTRQISSHIWENKNGIAMTLFTIEELSSMLQENNFIILEQEEEIFKLDVGIRSNVSLLLKRREQ